MTILNYNVFAYPAHPAVEGAVHMAVLTEGAVEDFAVYEAIVPERWDRNDAAKWVARNGAKATYRRAVAHFPDLPKDRYRA